MHTETQLIKEQKHEKYRQDIDFTARFNFSLKAVSFRHQKFKLDSSILWKQHCAVRLIYQQIDS